MLLATKKAKVQLKTKLKGKQVRQRSGGLLEVSLVRIMCFLPLENTKKGTPGRSQLMVIVVFLLAKPHVPRSSFSKEQVPEGVGKDTGLKTKLLQSQLRAEAREAQRS